MSPELQRILAEHQMMVDVGIDSEVIRHIVKRFGDEHEVLAETLIEYLLEATS